MPSRAAKSITPPPRRDSAAAPPITEAEARAEFQACANLMRDVALRLRVLGKRLAPLAPKGDRLEAMYEDEIPFSWLGFAFREASSAEDTAPTVAELERAATVTEDELREKFEERKIRRLQQRQARQEVTR